MDYKDTIAFYCEYFEIGERNATEEEKFRNRPQYAVSS
jgi:hypothetical protein